MIICKSRTELGVKTAELDSIADSYIRSRGAVPSFTGYNGFPSSICTSVNEELQLEGFHGDSAKPGARLYTISHAKQKVAEAAGFSTFEISTIS